MASAIPSHPSLGEVQKESKSLHSSMEGCSTHKRPDNKDLTSETEKTTSIAAHGIDPCKKPSLGGPSEDNIPRQISAKNRGARTISCGAQIPGQSDLKMPESDNAPSKKTALDLLSKRS